MPPSPPYTYIAPLLLQNLSQQNYQLATGVNDPIIGFCFYRVKFLRRAKENTTARTRSYVYHDTTKRRYMRRTHKQRTCTHKQTQIYSEANDEFVFIMDPIPPITYVVHNST